MKDKLPKGYMKSLITVVGLALWLFFCVYGAVTGQFNDVFEFFKTQFAIIVAFFFGTQFSKKEDSNG